MTSIAQNGRSGCRTTNCSGHYINNSITKTVRHAGRLVVLENVPAEVCDICGDTLIAPLTMRRIEEILSRSATPGDTAPVYKYG